MSDSDDDPIFDAGVFGTAPGLEVRIMDLSGANGSDPVETVRGFETIAHANAFARRYVRDSIDRCRAPRMPGDAVLEAWFAFGEDATVVGAGEQAWLSANEIRDFAGQAAPDPEDRNWRVLDPRRFDEDEEDE